MSRGLRISARSHCPLRGAVAGLSFIPGDAEETWTKNERLLSGLLELYFNRLTWAAESGTTTLFQPNLILCHSLSLSSPRSESPSPPPDWPVSRHLNTPTWILSCRVGGTRDLFDHSIQINVSLLADVSMFFFICAHLYQHHLKINSHIQIIASVSAITYRQHSVQITAIKAISFACTVR